MKSRKIRKYIPSGKALLILIIVLVGLFTVKILRNAFLFARTNGITPGFVKNLALGKYDTLKSRKRRANVVLLGVSGGTHEGANLTDTIQFVSLSLEKVDLVMLSIPRDVWLPSLKQRINAAYEDGEAKKVGGGFILAKAAVEEVLGIPVQYAAIVNFSGFVQIIDFVGGIDVDVAQAFDDHFYPIAGKENDFCAGDPDFSCRYESLHFDKGLQQMDGARALKFVRSRHGTNSQGSDFARSSRQQKVILAFRQKALSSQTLLNPARVIELTQTFGKSVDTDVPEDDVSHFAKLVSQIDTSRIRRVVLDSEMEDSPLEVGDAVSYSGQFVLVPKGGVWRDLAEYVQGEIFKLDEK